MNTWDEECMGAQAGHFDYRGDCLCLCVLCNDDDGCTCPECAGVDCRHEVKTS